MTIQELIDHAILNQIPFESEIYLHHFTTGFEPALIKDIEDYVEGESILKTWPDNALVLSNQTA